MSNHINADLYWDKSDIKSHIVDLKEFKKLVADIKGASVIDEAIDFAQEIYDELEWDEEDYEEYYEDKYKKELNKLETLAKKDKRIIIELNTEETDDTDPYFDIIIDEERVYNDYPLDYEDTEKMLKKFANGYKIVCIKSCKCKNKNSEYFDCRIEEGDKFEAYKYDNGTWCLCEGFDDDWTDEDYKNNPHIGPNGFISVESFDEYFKVLGKIYEKC